MTRLRDWSLLLICNLIWASQFVLVKIVQEQAGDKLYLAVVNRNESAEVVSSIRVSGWSPGRAAEAARKTSTSGSEAWRPAGRCSSIASTRQRLTAPGFPAVAEAAARPAEIGLDRGRGRAKNGGRRGTFQSIENFFRRVPVEGGRESWRNLSLCTPKNHPEERCLQNGHPRRPLCFPDERYSGIWESS